MAEEKLPPKLRILPELKSPWYQAHLIHKAGYRLKDGATGAVTLIQRFGSALNLCMANSYFINNIRRLAIAAFWRRHYPRTA